MKAHLVTIEFPIIAGQNQLADCGQQVPSAQIVFMWDEQLMGEGLSYGKNVCNKCQLADKGPRAKMLVYGIAEQAEAESTQRRQG